MAMAIFGLFIKNLHNKKKRSVYKDKEIKTLILKLNSWIWDFSLLHESLYLNKIFLLYV